MAILFTYRASHIHLNREALTEKFGWSYRLVFVLTLVIATGLVMYLITNLETNLLHPDFSTTDSPISLLITSYLGYLTVLSILCYLTTLLSFKHQPESWKIYSLSFFTIPFIYILLASFSEIPDWIISFLATGQLYLYAIYVGRALLPKHHITQK